MKKIISASQAFAGFVKRILPNCNKINPPIDEQSKQLYTHRVSSCLPYKRRFVAMPIQCTDAEWKILEVLWDRSPRTMSEIMKTLEPTMGWTRHTVISLLKRMEEKGTVKVDESGPQKTYTPPWERRRLPPSRPGNSSPISSRAGLPCWSTIWFPPVI